MKAILILLILLAGCATEINEVNNMKVESDDFDPNGDMPRDITCQGNDSSPHLRWEAVEGAKSYALSLIDPDTPFGDFIHWFVHDIPAETTEFVQGTYLGTQVENDFGKQDYGGPCPPAGKHRYVFTVYALDVEKLEGVTKDNFLEKVGEHTIDKGQVAGVYEKH